METKPGYSEWVPNFYLGSVKKVTVVPTDDGSQEYQVTMVIPRNEVTRDLGDFVGQPVRLAIKSIQLPLPATTRRETVTAPIVAQTTRPPIVIDEQTGEVMDSVTLSDNLPPEAPVAGTEPVGPWPGDG